MDIILIIFAEIFTFITITTTIYKYVNMNFINSGESIIKGIFSIFIFIVVYHLIGYILLFSSRINKFIIKTENKSFKTNFILSYFLISTYLAIMLLFPKEFNKMAIIVLIGIVISYILNLKLLLDLMINPTNAKSIKKDGVEFSRIMIAALLILLIIVLNLYLAVCAINGVEPNSYTNTNGDFSLFYYTIITFTTVGYGDIVPLSIGARIVSIVISLTSVICITIFLSSILSYRDKFKEE
ncbi:potassium channel family protein [Clostridium thermobutyricum]|nr:potassium channel family protein [Clostridium thermobutyricum]